MEISNTTKDSLDDGSHFIMNNNEWCIANLENRVYNFPSSIYFYKANDEYGFMSNFYKQSFDGIDSMNKKHTYCCNEQYFMYEKCLLFDKENISLLENILQETDPTKIKKFGRYVKKYDDKEWSKCRYIIMKTGLLYKFASQEMKQKLIETNNKILYEASPTDAIWGIGFDAITALSRNKSEYGENLLGKCLMEVREELKK